MTLQLPLFDPECAPWSPPLLADLPTDWNVFSRMAVDCETNDEHLKKLGIGTRRGAYIVGISLAFEDGPSCYLPIRHEGGDNMPDVDQVLEYVRYHAKHFKGTVCGANLPYDMDHLQNENITFDACEWFRDIQLADPLINEMQNSYSLDNIAKRYGLPGKNEEALRKAAAAFGVDPKAEMWKLAARYVGAYATTDAVMPLLCLRRQERIIDERNLWEVYDLESKVLPVLHKMRRRGVKIDTDRLQQIEDWSLLEERKELAFIKRETNIVIPIGDGVTKARLLAPVLEHIGLKIHKTPKGQPNIDQVVLQGADHPVATSILRARKLAKLRNTFVGSIKRHMTTGNKIHGTFHQMAREDDKGDQKGVRYGRLSCTNPNLQQQPNPKRASDVTGGEWRKIYIPEDGAVWGCLDYSQQEPRWTTHFAALMKLPKAQEAAQAYHDDPNIDNHQFMADLTGLKRTYAKAVYLGLCYGEGGAKLCDDLNLPTRWAINVKSKREVFYFETQEEALKCRAEYGEGFVWRAAGEEGQNILNRFDNKAPFIKKLANAAKKRADAKGIITTIMGRQLNFPREKNGGGFGYTYKALNRLIQGSAADQTKQALVEGDAAGFYMQLQVHDEIDGSFGTVDEAKKLANIMRECVPNILVPFRVDTEIGPNWGELENMG